eukprot:COSAG02_NODE_766_length_17389_cov_29.287045_10_plen_90_part_00
MITVGGSTCLLGSDYNLCFCVYTSLTGLPAHLFPCRDARIRIRIIDRIRIRDYGIDSAFFLKNKSPHGNKHLAESASQRPDSLPGRPEI